MCQLVLWLQKEVCGHALPMKFDCVCSIILFAFISNREKSKRGIVPKSFVHIVDSVLTPKNEYVVKRSTIVDEITTVLEDWGVLFKRFYLTNHENFQPIRRKILELIKLRAQILSGNLPVDEMKEIKLMATSEIDTGNKLLGTLHSVAVPVSIKLRIHGIHYTL